MLNELRCHAHFQFSANQITWSRSLIWIHILNDKLCRSRSVGNWSGATLFAQAGHIRGSGGLGLIYANASYLISPKYTYLLSNMNFPKKRFPYSGGDFCACIISPTVWFQSPCGACYSSTKISQWEANVLPPLTLPKESFSPQYPESL